MSRPRIGGVLLLAAWFACGCSGAPAKPPEPEAPAATPVATPPPTPGVQPQTPPVAAASHFSRLANGLTLLVTAAPADAEAQLQLGLLAGTDFMAAGLAELAAETLVAGSDASQGRPSLQQAARGLGGTLHVEVGPQSTWITLRVPGDRWQDALQALSTAVGSPTQSRSQIERIRDELVEQRCRAIWQQPDLEATRMLLLGDSGTGPHLAQLLDRDASEVSLFLSRLYRPEMAMLSLQVPGQPAAVADAVARSAPPGIAHWSPATAAAGAIPMQARRLVPGIYWSPADAAGPCRVSLVLSLPATTLPVAADLFVLHACLTLDGLGGRLEQLQRERGLGQLRWRSRFVQLAEVSAVVLTTEATPEQAAELWQVLAAARRSLRELPPTTSELALALRRAALTAQLGEGDTVAQMRNRANLALRRVEPGFLARRFRALQRAGELDLAGATEAYLALPTAMLVFGGKVPTGLTDVTTFDLLPPGALARMVGGDPRAQSVAATPWLEQAMTAIGGRAQLRRLAGYSSEGRLQANAAPAVGESLVWNEDGRLERTREVLGSKVETRVQGVTGTEQVDGQGFALQARDVALLRREMQRHPLAILAAHARGELQFRPVAQRRVGDRELMILEALGDRFDRLRLHVDAESHLVRTVEVWETMGDGSVVHLQEAWSDYRPAGGLRAPFRRITEQDDGQNRIETLYSSWTPAFSTR